MKNTHMPIVLLGIGNCYRKKTWIRHDLGIRFIIYCEEIMMLSSFTKYQYCSMEKVLLHNRDVFLCIPHVFMNNSGTVIHDLKKHIGEFILIVFHDEIERALGDIRIKDFKGSGGHNGIRSIRQYYHCKNAYRVGMGVGRPHNNYISVNEHVLSPFEKEEQAIIDLLLCSMHKHLPYLFQGRNAWNEFEENCKRDILC